jgi:hypothetical protein
MHRQVSQDPASTYIVKYHGFRLREDLHMYHVASSYAEYSELEAITALFGPRDKNYNHQKILIDSQGKIARFRATTPKIPLRFALELFIALIKGCQHMIGRYVIH